MTHRIAACAFAGFVIITAYFVCRRYAYLTTNQHVPTKSNEDGPHVSEPLEADYECLSLTQVTAPQTQSYSQLGVLVQLAISNDCNKTIRIAESIETALLVAFKVEDSNGMRLSRQRNIDEIDTPDKHNTSVYDIAPKSTVRIDHRIPWAIEPTRVEIHTRGDDGPTEIRLKRSLVGSAVPNYGQLHITSYTMGNGVLKALGNIDIAIVGAP